MYQVEVNGIFYLTTESGQVLKYYPINITFLCNYVLTNIYIKGLFNDSSDYYLGETHKSVVAQILYISVSEPIFIQLYFN